MTTKVKIAISQMHNPVVVQVLRHDGTVGWEYTLSELGQEVEDYVHSGQMLRIMELTAEEAQSRKVNQ